MKSDLDSIRGRLIFKINGPVSFRKSSQSDEIFVETDIHQAIGSGLKLIWSLYLPHFQGPAITVHFKVVF